MERDHHIEIPDQELFVGRLNELKLLNKLLRNNNVVEINGLGGIGKTTFVKQFIYTNRENIAFSFWLNHSEIANEDSNSFRLIIDELKLIDSKIDADVNSNRLKVIVIDDVTKMDYSIASLIDLFSIKWKIIIISRVDISNQIPSLNLSFLNQAEAFNFFKNYVNKWSNKDIENQKNTLFRLLEFSGYTPLAIEIIAKIVNERDIKNVEEIEKLLQDYSNLSLYLPNKPIGIYLDTDDIDKIDGVYSAVKKYLSNKNIEIEYDLPPKKGSWFKRLFTKGKDIVSSPEFKKKFEEVEHAIKLKTIKKEQSEIDKNQSEAVANILNSTKDIPNIAINIGSLLLVKITDSNGIPKIAVKSLSITEMIAIEKNPELLQTPNQILEQLKKIETKQLEEENNA